MPANFLKLLGVLLIIFHTPCYAQDPGSMNESPGMTYALNNENVAITKVKPDIDFSKYNKIQLQLTEVSFKKGWEREYRTSPAYRITTKEIEQLKERVSELFYEVFTEELQNNSSFTIVDEPGEDVLTLKAAIVDLDITDPDLFRPRRQTVFVEYAGEATFTGEISDSISGDALLKIDDHKRARRSIIHLERSSRVKNIQEGKRILRKWADLIKQHIEYSPKMTG